MVPMPSPTFDELLQSRIHEWGGHRDGHGPPPAAQLAPPHNSAEPTSIDLAITLYRDDAGAAVSIDRFECWPDGFTAWIRHDGHPPQSEHEQQVFTSRAHNILGEPRSSFRLAIVYNDGRWSATVNSAARDRFDGVLLTSIEGGSLQRGLEERLYVWPRPPNGPISIITEWRGRRLPALEHELDGEQIHQASVEAATRRS